MSDATPDARETTSPHYHPIGIFFHWLMACLVFAQLWWGWRTSALAAGYDKADAYVIHAQIGVAILLASFLRLGWRLMAPFVAPKLEEPEDLPGWQRLAAEATHWALYVVMIALPVSGLIMLGATAPQTLKKAFGFGLSLDPDLVARAKLEHAAETAHLSLIVVMCCLLVAHIGAALKHHFIDRDDVLARMVPILDRDRPSAARIDRTTNAAR